MIRAIATRILRKILLVIVGAEAFSSAEIKQLSGRDQSPGRISVDVAVDPLVDQPQSGRRNVRVWPLGAGRERQL